MTIFCFFFSQILTTQQKWRPPFRVAKSVRHTPFTGAHKLTRVEKIVLREFLAERSYSPIRLLLYDTIPKRSSVPSHASLWWNRAYCCGRAVPVCLRVCVFRDRVVDPVIVHISDFFSRYFPSQEFQTVRRGGQIRGRRH